MVQRVAFATPVKVLCVDDDAYLTDLLRYALNREGYTVQIAESATAARHAVESDLPDIAVLDVNLPDGNGLALCAHFRVTLGIPVIMLTARYGEEDVIAGFAQGADDYITKPFSMQILIARLQTVLRRVHGAEQASNQRRRPIRLGVGLFSVEHNQIIVNARSYQLTLTEGRILHLLATHEAQVLSAERIMQRLWVFDTDSNTSVIKTHIRNLRAKLAEALGDCQVIHTVPGLGYTFRQALPATGQVESAASLSTAQY